MHAVGLKDYLQILRRRKWVVLVALLLVPAVSVVLALQQVPLYQTSADVLLRSQSLPSALSGIADPNSSTFYVDPIRATGTQIEIALLPAMAKRVVRALPERHLTTANVLGSIGVFAVPNSDFLRFQATSTDPQLAPVLATEYAKQYTLYRRKLDTDAAAQALRDLQARIASLKTSPGAASRAAALDLQSKSDQLQTYMTLTKANAVLVRLAGPAAKIRPRPVRYAIFGIGLGLVLGIGLAFLFDLLDTRLRSTEAIQALLGLPLLARLSAPGRQLRRTNKLAMLVEPNSNSGEAFRMLRANLEFVTFERQAQVVMVISAAEEEGKTTTISNLAVALARAGRRVILVDLDLRRPSIDLFFPRSDGRRAGLTDVVLGRATLDQALIPVAAADGVGMLPNYAEGLSGDIQPNGDRPRVSGDLQVLTTGLLPPDPGEFVGLRGVKSVISELRTRAEIILIDTPPLLQVGDAKVIARFVDASVVVVRAEQASRPVVSELARVLAEWPAPPVGFVLCGADALGGYYYSSYGYQNTVGVPVGTERAVGERIG